jgi:hypothetical protein
MPSIPRPSKVNLFCASVEPSRYLLALIVFLLVGYGSRSNAQRLSPEATVSLITVAPGAELYSSFGHSAYWINDPATGVDRIYNYGTFDFRTGNFYLKFLRGTLPYLLTVVPSYYQFEAARQEGRRVTEQVLSLTPGQKQRMFDFLETNARPENREYRYKFFYDNCSTRPRDVIKAVCGDSLTFSDTRPDYRLSYRQWMNRYLDGRDWARFGMNLGIGEPADERADSWEAQYLPDNLAEAFDHAQLSVPGERRPLVGQTRTLFEAPPARVESPWLTPGLVLWVLFALGAGYTAWQVARDNTATGFDRFLFGLTGVIGLIFLLLWLATDHGVTGPNLNLLWALPTHLVVMRYLRAPRPWVTYYLYVTAGLLLSAFLGVTMNSLPQQFPPEVLPLVLLLLVRTAWLLYQRAQQNPD